MSNEKVTKTVKTNNTNGKDSVFNSVLKTNCIVCNTAYLKPRVGKLYCSNRCKQFGYNHKERKLEQLPETNKEVRRTQRRFLLKDYAYFVEMNVKLKRYRELSKRFEKFKDEEKRMYLEREYGIQSDQRNAFNYYQYQLNESELYEFETLQDELEMYKNLEPQNLTIEQWCFFKALFKKMPNENLFTIICQFSKDYIKQLNIMPMDLESTSEQINIKRNYLYLCNEITDGVIQFL
jgi:hypothetical protein